MWKITYNVFTICVLPFFVLYALTKQKIRSNLRERLLPDTGGEGTDTQIWIHAASIGETVIADNLIQCLKDKNSPGQFLVTTNTYYAKELLQKKGRARVQVHALPFDFFFSMKRFLKKLRPKALLIVETELWPNLIWLSKKEGIPVMIVNGRISDSTLKNYLRFSFFMRSVFSNLDLVLAQSEVHQKRFISIGVDPDRVITTGNIKYYRPAEDSNNFTKQNAITFGSIKEKELPAVYAATAALLKIFPEYTFYIVPRELHLSSLIEKDLSASMHVTRYSAGKANDIGGSNIVIVDTVGDLLNIYKQSKVAFVGGSLAPYGGQNILEPLFFGTPVLFGPYIENFSAIARRVVDLNAGFIVHSADELTNKIALILNDERLRMKMGQNGCLVTQEQEQAMKNTVDCILKKIRN